MEEKEQLKEYRREINNLQHRVQHLQDKNNKLQEENQDLKSALRDKIMDERLEILKISRQNLKTYFSIRANDYKDRLTALEDEIEARLDRLKRKSEVKLADDSDEIKKKISELETEIEEDIDYRREEFFTQQEEIVSDYESGVERLENREIDERTIEQRKNHHAVEEEVGINLLNKLGIGLILLGLGFLYRYFMVNWLNNFWDGIGFFILGGLFSGAGEWFYRQNKPTLNQLFSTGGVMAYYGGVFYLYFILNFFGLNLGIGLTAVFTAAAYILADRYNFLPLAAAGTGAVYLGLYLYIAGSGIEGINFHFCIGYLVVAGGAMLARAWYENWKLLIYVNYILHLPWLIYLTRYGSELIGITYTGILSGGYLALIIGYHLYNELELGLIDFIFIGLNLLVNSLLLGILVGLGSNGLGILVLVLGIIYLGISWFIKSSSLNNSLGLVIEIAALLLIISAVPLTVKRSLWMIGWLGEAFILTLAGFYYQTKFIELSGKISFILSGLIYYAVDCRLQFIGPGADNFLIKSILFSLGLAGGFIFYLHKIETSRELTVYDWQFRFFNYYKYFTIINIWLTAVYLVFRLGGRLVPTSQLQFYSLGAVVILNSLVGCLLVKVKQLQDRVTNWFTVFLSVTAGGLIQYLNWNWSVLELGTRGINYLGLFFLTISNFLFLITLYWLGLKLLGRWRYGLQSYLTLLGIWIMLVVTSFWLVQLQFEAAAVSFSFIYLVLAALFLGYGFYRGLSYLRILGLVLILLALGKMLLLDLAGLELVNKIAIYLGSGGLLLLISLKYDELKRAVKNRRNEIKE